MSSQTASMLKKRLKDVGPSDYCRILSHSHKAMENLFTGNVSRCYKTKLGREFKVSATLKIAIFPYLRFQRFQINMLESFLLKKKSEESIISVQRYRG